MQKLFDFVPSAVKPDGQFFKSEQCEIIRKHTDGRGYFVITDERLPRMSAYMPQNYCRMWWVIKLPTSTRLAPKIRCFRSVTVTPSK